MNDKFKDQSRYATNESRQGVIVMVSPLPKTGLTNYPILYIDLPAFIISRTYKKANKQPVKQRARFTADGTVISQKYAQTVL